MHPWRPRRGERVLAEVLVPTRPYSRLETFPSMMWAMRWLRTVVETDLELEGHRNSATLRITRIRDGRRLMNGISSFYR